MRTLAIDPRLHAIFAIVFGAAVAVFLIACEAAGNVMVFK